MEDTGRIEAITRREFLAYGGIAAASLALGGIAGADALDRLQQYREKVFGQERFAWYTKLFGKDPILADGALEKISYGQWVRDQKKGTIEFREGVIAASQFMKSKETRLLYRDAFGTDAPDFWLKDRKRVSTALLHGIHAPDYDQHRTIRELLHQDGILDFESHKKAVEQGLKEAPAYLKSQIAQKARDVVGTLVDERSIDDAAHGLEQLYLLTLPVFDGQQYRRIEDNMYSTVQKGLKALENAKNLEKAMQQDDYVQVAHQLKSFIGRFKDVLDEVGKLTGRSLVIRTDVMEELGVMKNMTVSHLEGFVQDESVIQTEGRIQAFDYIADEWEQLDLHSWANRVATDTKMLLR